MRPKKERHNFKPGDKVKLRADVLQQHARSVPAHIGYTSEQFAWRATLDKQEGKVGVIERIFPDSDHVNVQFENTLIGINASELVLAKANPGFTEAQKPILTKKGIENKAPRHRDAALRERYSSALRSPLYSEPIESERREAHLAFERSERPEYQKLDFFLSCSPRKSKEEYQTYIIAALMDERRKDMLEWLQQKYNSSYPIQKIPDIVRLSENPFLVKQISSGTIRPIEEKWKVIYHEECAAHSWQISQDGYWDESGDISDVALQIYENGYIIMAHGMDVRGFRL